MLWDAYGAGHGVRLGSGISAMPSMHVASSVLFFLLARRVGRAAGWAFGIFALLIFVGSVHLAWHYALDGYVGAAGALLLWRAVGWALSRPRRGVPAVSPAPLAPAAIPA